MTMFTRDELLSLLDAVTYKLDVARANDPKQAAEVWWPLYVKIEAVLAGSKA